MQALAAAGAARRGDSGLALSDETLLLTEIRDLLASRGKPRV